jgi:tetratricopeptide (TPR) repeat protein
VTPVPDRLIIDLHPDRRVEVASWPEGQASPDVPGEALGLSWPLDDEMLEGLRWYLEDYLRAPFGVYGDRGPAIEADLDNWGRQIFAGLFGTGHPFLREHPRAELVCRSSSAPLLALPWELMRDPAGEPVAIAPGGIVRCLPSAHLDRPITAVGDRLRILMVIARPRGSADVGYRMIARPLLSELGSVRGRAELTVLRPPTFDALTASLADARADGEPFHVVHFDGHGGLAGAEGELSFERPRGGSDRVRATRLAEALADAGVPLVVLNACQSGAVGKQLEAAVATSLLKAGVPSVVAMAYRVYPVAAAAFMSVFYQRLFAGAGVVEAMTAGRRQMYRHNARPSPRGAMPLADWVVPVHYLGRDVFFPQLITKPDREVGRDTGPELAPVGGFVGRDRLLYDMEVTTRERQVVVLHGQAGTGKTELAKAFGRWWRDTGGVDRPDWVIAHSFEPGAASSGLDVIVADIALHVWGPPSAKLDNGARATAVEQALAENRMLLIWENFETVHSMPDVTGATPMADATQRGEFRAFVDRLAGGRSTLVITSRASEEWLGDVQRVEVGGLTVDEAIEYAEDLLDPLPRAASRLASRSYADLQEWLGGHPLSMRLVLPHLQTTDPGPLLEDLREGRVRSGDERAGSPLLDAGLDYSLNHIDRRTSRLLVAVSFFQGVVDADVLGALRHVPGTPPRFAELDGRSWRTVLDDAVNVGLLTDLGDGMYRIHPALPGSLQAHWRAEDPDGHEAERAATLRSLRTVHAHLGVELLDQMDGDNAERALRVIDQQQRTLGYMLAGALRDRAWREAANIAKPLVRYLEQRGLSPEADAWVHRVLACPLSTQDPAAGNLQLFALSTRARHQRDAGRLSDAERSYTAMLDALTTRALDQRQWYLAEVYRGLGSLAHERHELVEADEWHARASTIDREIGNHREASVSDHERGYTAHRANRFAEAERWYRQSLEISSGLGDRRLMGTTSHHLGWLMEDVGRLDEAEHWLSEALMIATDLQVRPLLARIHHSLGRLAHARRRYEDAEKWYVHSLEIKEEVADRTILASTYHQLGMLAHDRGRSAEAVAWLTKAIALNEEFGDTSRLAGNYHELGLVAATDGRLEEAEGWLTEALRIRRELGDTRFVDGVTRQLATIAFKYLDRGWNAYEHDDLQIAEDQLTKSLALYTQLGDQERIADIIRRLGGIAATQGRFGEAMDRAIRSVRVFGFFDERSEDARDMLVRLTAILGTDAFERTWDVVNGDRVPRSVRRFVRSGYKGLT